jgi:putative transposase
MGEMVSGLCRFVVSALRSKRDLVLENAALRHQLMVLQRQSKAPRIKNRDRLFWITLLRLWPDWRDALSLVQPATVVRWHRKGFRAYWRWKSRTNGGRPRIDREVRELIRDMWTSNPTWGKLRIRAELAKIGIDFFVVPTVTFRVLYVFLVMSHDRRRILHFNVTTSPSAPWTAQQVVEAFPYESSPRFLLRDRDKIFGSTFVSRVESMGIEEVVTAPGSPWQNPFCERLIGSVRRDCLDHVIILNERHLLRVLRSYASYYHASRTHRSLDHDCPEPRPIEPADMGKVVAQPQVGGLHHRYSRQLAA